MATGAEHYELVRKARHGDRLALERLSHLATQKLRAYVYRLTLDETITVDIVQESMLEMVRFLEQLENDEKFWPWLRKIANSKLCKHTRSEQQRSVTYRNAGNTRLHGDQKDGLADLVSSEIKQIVTDSMAALTARHRQVLILRCYEGLSFRQIAEEMDCTQIGARMLFMRGKNALARQLGRRALGKGALLLAIVVFGKITAQSEAAAVGVSTTAASLEVGMAGTIAALLVSKTAIVTVLTAGIIGAGALALREQPDNAAALDNGRVVTELPATSSPVGRGAEEHWYYYPYGEGGPVTMRVMTGGSGQQQPETVWRVNEQANYRYQASDNTIHIENHRPWNKDLSVWRLPTDGPQLRDFLARMDKVKYEPQYVSDAAAGLLVVAKRNSETGLWKTECSYEHFLLYEEYFRYELPASAKVIDNRDEMHKRGWTFFELEGDINGQRLRGTGCVPFVLAASNEHRPWIKIQVAGKTIIDTGFVGLARPWMGLHTLDVVRRDAAALAMPFETRSQRDGKNAEVELRSEGVAIIYIIDMEHDLIESITFQGRGIILFNYLQDVGNVGSEFSEPTGQVEKNRGVLWLAEETGGGK